MVREVDPKRRVGSRRKRRGESEEDYQKRIARLDQVREAVGRHRNRREAGAVTKVDTVEVEPEERASVHRAPNVVEVILEREHSEAARARAEAAELRRQLDVERTERRRLEAQVELYRAELTRRIAEQKRRDEEEARKSAEAAVIIKEVGESNLITSVDYPDHEIIEDSGDRNHDDYIGPEKSDNTLKSYDESAGGNHGEIDPSFITLIGYKGGAGRGDYTASSSAEENAEQKVEHATTPRRLPVLVAAERLMWVGWLDHARQAHPRQTLFAKFGSAEAMMFRDLVAAACELAGWRNIDAEVERLPCAFELAWALRRALDTLPPASSVQKLIARCMSSLLRPGPRSSLGVLGAAESLGNIDGLYALVQSEIETGSLVIDRTEEP